MKRILEEVFEYKGKFYKGKTDFSETYATESNRVNVNPWIMHPILLDYFNPREKFVKKLSRSAPIDADGFMLSLPGYNGRSYVEGETVAVVWVKI